MSVRALETAVLTWLQKPVVDGGLGYNKTNSAIVGPDGRPHPRAGTWFVGVHSAYQRGRQEGSSEEEYGIDITVSRRLEAPFDRIGPEVKNHAVQGLNQHCEAIKAMMLRRQYSIIATANNIIGASSGFVEPLFFIDGDARSVEVSADWYSADGSEEGMNTVGLKRTMRFGGAVRIQALESVT